MPHAGTEAGLIQNGTSPIPMNQGLKTATNDAGYNFYRLEEILIERCRTTPDVPLIGYPANAHTAESYVYYTPRQIDRFVNGAVMDFKIQGLHIQDHRSLKDSPVVALLGPANLDYVVAVFALARMGYAVFYLSTRLSQEAYLSLLKQTNCKHIVYAEIPTLTKSVSELCTQEGNLQSFIFPTQAMYMSSTQSSEYAFNSKPEDSTRTAYIIHSSGSSGVPKAIPSIHRAGISNYTFSKSFGSYFVTLPFYHGHGVSMFFRAVFKGKPIALYNASLPLTGSHLVKGLRTIKPESFHCVPYALKLIAETYGGIEALSGAKQVLFGGSSCPDDLGDKLVNGGVRLISHYGATELGQVMTSDRPLDDKAWNYLHPLPTAAPYLMFDPLEDGTLETVVLDGLPSKSKSNLDNPPNSFRTSDCFIKHPTLENRWKYIGRLDDRINLVNGEKVLPIPIEHRIRQNKLVKEVLVVGVGKFSPGILIVPSDHAQGLEKTDAFNIIWPDIAAANSNAESFSQISRDMVEILPVGTWYPKTEKGTLMRKACYKHFEDIIEHLFNCSNGLAQEKKATSSVTKVRLSVTGIEEFLAGVIQRDLGFSHIDIDTDFFTAGMDSLQAIKAHGFITQHLDLGNKNLNENALYEFGNIKNLAAHLYNLRIGEQTATEDDLAVMRDLIEKYSTFLKPPSAIEDNILLTGTTGSLGCYILSKLLSKDSVKRVYCLVRASSADADFDRIVYTLSARNLPLRNLSKIRPLPADISRPDLGLAPDIIQELRYTLTKIIHSAWVVNFNIGVRSFEEHHIAGVRNMINLCLSSKRQSPAEFYFCSSISTAAGTPLSATIAERPVSELSHAHDMGYARSKLVAERIVQAAAEQTGMISKILRVGQIVGDTVHGRWNPDEGIPLMIRSAITLGALPALEETPSWTPVDIVAQAVLELCSIEAPMQDSSKKLRKYSEDSTVVYHVLNSSVFHWTKDLLPALRDAGLEFEIVGQKEWIKRLRESDQDPVKNPTVKLKDFYAGKYDNESSRAGLTYCTKLTEDICPSLRGGIELISIGIVKKFVNSWLADWEM